MLIVVVVVAWSVIAAGAAFIFDDFIYFEASSERGLRHGWLGSVWFQHWAPLHRLTFWGIQRFTPLEWLPTFAAMLLLLVAATLLLWLVLRELYGPRWLHVGLTALFALSIIHVVAFQWASAGFQTLPDAACSLGAIYAFLRHRRGGGWPWALAAGAFTVLCLGFYVRGILVPVWCAAVWLVLQPTALRPRALLAQLRDDWRVWLCVLVPVLAYTAHYVLADISGSTPAPALTQVEQYARIAWLRGFTPAWLTGVQIPQSDLARGDVVAEVVTQLAVLATIVIAVVRSRVAALRGAVFWAIAFAATIGLVAIGRLQGLGPSIGYDLRYLSDLAWLCPIALAAAFAPLPPAPPFRRAVRPGLLLGAGAAVLVVHCVIAFREAQTMRRNWPSATAKAYVATLRDGIRAAQAAGPVTMLDGIAPERVIFGNSSPYNRLSRLVPLFVDGVRFDATAPAPYVADAGGHVRRVRFTPRDALALSAFTAVGTTRTSGTARCARAGQVTLTYRPRSPLTAADYALQLRLGNRAPAPVAVSADAGDGFPGIAPVEIPAYRPVAQTVDLATQRVDAVRLTLPPGVCLRGATIGVLTATR